MRGASTKLRSGRLCDLRRCSAGLVKGDNPVTLLLGVRHDHATSCFDQSKRFADLDSPTDHCARGDNGRSADPCPAVNRDRTAVGKTASDGPRNTQRLLNLRHATIRNRKGDEFNSTRAAKLSFPLQTKFGDLVRLKETYDQMDAGSFPFTNVHSNQSSARGRAMMASRPAISIQCNRDIQDRLGIQHVFKLTVKSPLLQPGTPRFLSTKHAPPALRMRLQRSSASPRVSAPKRTW